MTKQIELNQHQLRILSNLLEYCKEQATEDTAEILNDSMPYLSFDQQFKNWEELIEIIETAVVK